VLTFAPALVPFSGGCFAQSWFDHTDIQRLSVRTRSDRSRSVNMTTTALQLEALLSERATQAVDESCSCGLGLVGHGEAYNEDAFHHFLAIERKRSEVSARPFLLLLVEFDPSFACVGRDLAGQIFTALSLSLRDTDVVGWYRSDRIAGALLTDLGDAPEVHAPEQISARVQGMLRQQLPPAAGSSVQVRIYPAPARENAAPARWRS